MTTLTTILVWLGSGIVFALGAMIGVMISGSIFKNANERAEAANLINAVPNDLLRERNAIGLRQAEALERLVAIANEYVDLDDRRDEDHRGDGFDVKTR